MAKKMKAWTKVIEEHGVRIRLFERGGIIYRDIALGRTVSASGQSRTAHSVKSMGHPDRELAERQAKELAKRIAEARLTGQDLRSISLGQVFGLYFRLKAPTLSPKWRGAAEMRRDLFEACWGAEQPVEDISRVHVDRFCQERRSSRLAPDRQGRKIEAVRDGTLDGDFRWLSSVFNWARRHKEGGRRLVQENPLHDLEWPKEKNPRRPVASHERYVKTLANADQVDPRGRLRCILALARYAGRREGAIYALRASDVLRSPQAVRAAIADAGMDERLAEHMPHGAVRWSDASDKMGLLFVSPLSVPAREELDRYLLPMLPPASKDAPLFPSDEDPNIAIRTDVASRWLLKAEAEAGLPKLRGGIFHPFRRLWATERKHLPDVDVAAAGGWRDTRALKLSYQQADPASVLRVVELGG